MLTMTTGIIQRRDPLAISWLLKCDQDQSAHVEQVLRSETGQDAEIVDIISSSPGGQTTNESRTHRLADYFSDIQITGQPSNGDMTLTFHRRPDAGRFWKDVMMRILDSARRAGARVEPASSTK
jgi:hypothetical protein